MNPNDKNDAQGASLSHRFIEPLDVLFLRGNKLFGDPGSHGESLVPPWPAISPSSSLESWACARRVGLSVS